jgi:LmbE family N-acetylglucosaminyl deacetylase
MNSRILIVAAHPDDEILGCGGTVARMVKEGCKAYTLILGGGVASREGVKDKAAQIARLKKQAMAANKIIGVSESYFFDFPDNKFDTAPLLDIVKAVEKIKNRVQPDIVFTHYMRDLNIDHRVAFQAAITATRPCPGEKVREIYSFAVPSSTEWNYPMSFFPEAFFDVGDTMNLKLKAMAEYKGELEDFPHPRSLEGVRLNAQYWGSQVGLSHAEVFKVIRQVR